MSQAERLRTARERATFKSGSDAARRFGWRVSTYLAHENGQNNLREEVAKKYARAFKVPWTWLLSGEGTIDDPVLERREVPLVGYVGAGAVAHYYSSGQGPFETVRGPENATDDTVAVEARGASLGPAFDRWLVFYDDIRSPVTEDLLNRLCVVGLPDDRVLVKLLRQSRNPGLYHLFSNSSDEPILDVEVEWAAPVTAMMPKF